MSQFNLGLSPSQIEISLPPGSSYTQAYSLTNLSTETIILSTSVLPWLPQGNNGSVIYQNLNTPLTFSLMNADLSLGQDFNLAPGEKKQLVLKINNPSADSSDYYFTFFLTQKPLNQSLSQGQNLAKIGSHILISADTSAKIETDLKLYQFHLSSQIKDTFFPLQISGEILNNTSHFDHIVGTIKITRNRQPFFEKTLFPYTVLAQSTRRLHCLSENNQPLSCRLPAPLWPGHYRGTVTLNPDSQNYQYYFDFYVFPYLLILIIITFFSLFFLTLRKHTKNIKHSPHNSARLIK